MKPQSCHIETLENRCLLVAWDDDDFNSPSKDINCPSKDIHPKAAALVVGIYTSAVVVYTLATGRSGIENSIAEKAYFAAIATGIVAFDAAVIGSYSLYSESSSKHHVEEKSFTDSLTLPNIAAHAILAGVMALVNYRLSALIVKTLTPRPVDGWNHNTYFGLVS